MSTGTTYPVITLTHCRVMLDPYGFYLEATDGSGHVSTYTAAKHIARGWAQAYENSCAVHVIGFTMTARQDMPESYHAQVKLSDGSVRDLFGDFASCLAFAGRIRDEASQPA
jgi:hypothetical protein